MDITDGTQAIGESTSGITVVYIMATVMAALAFMVADGQADIFNITPQFGP